MSDADFFLKLNVEPSFNNEIPRRRFVICDQSLKSVGGHYHEYSGAVADAAEAAGFRAIILANAALRDPGVGATAMAGHPPRLVPWFPHTWAENDDIHAEFEPGNLVFEISRAIRELRLTSRDQMFVHTAGWHQITRMSTFLTGRTRWEARDQPLFHILARYPLSWMDAEQRERLRTVLRGAARRPHVMERLRLLTDTDRLTDSFERAFGVPFRTVPIPFRHDVLDAASGNSPRAGRPTRLVYLGDARREKGYHTLPDLAADLWSTRGRDVELIIQSNFNMPGGEPGLAEARDRLRAVPNVTLLTDPLESEDYYRVLAAADIVLAPYDPLAYGARSSGVLIEAMAAGKPVVSTRGSWMETQIEPDHGRVYDYPAGLSAAVRSALDDIETLVTGAAERAATWRHRSNPSTFFAALQSGVSHSEPAPARRPHVLLVMDGDAVILRNGAGRVARTQLDHLFRAGYEVTGVFLSMDPSRGPMEQIEWRRALDGELRDHPFAGVWGLHYAPDTGRGDRTRRLARMIERGEFSLTRDLMFAEGLAAPASLLRRLAEREVDVVILNYITAFPVLETLGVTGKPILCEMHDIQAFQKAIYGDREIDPSEVDFEIELLDRADTILCLNDKETEFVRPRLRHAKIHHNPLLVEGEPLTAVEMAGIRDLEELVTACGSSRPECLRDRPNVDSVDLLFVSSNHKSNASGLRWFLDEVYLPLLADRGVTLFIAGSIVELEGWPLSHPSIVFTGRVADLRPLYAAAKLIVLPIIEGAGSPVKTVEALSLGKPVVATPPAMRGLGRHDERLTVPTSAPEFAERVSRLLASEAERARVAEAGTALARAVNSRRVYDARLSAVLDDLLGGRGLVPPLAEDPAEPGDVVEWTPLLGAFNRVLRDWLIEEEPDERDRVRVVEASSPPPAWMETVWRSLFVTESAPFLRSRSEIGDRAREIVGDRISMTEFLADIAVRGPAEGSAEALRRAVRGLPRLRERWLLGKPLPRARVREVREIIETGDGVSDANTADFIPILLGLETPPSWRFREGIPRRSQWNAALGAWLLPEATTIEFDLTVERRVPLKIELSASFPGRGEAGGEPVRAPRFSVNGVEVGGGVVHPAPDGCLIVWTLPAAVERPSARRATLTISFDTPVLLLGITVRQRFDLATPSDVMPAATPMVGWHGPELRPFGWSRWSGPETASATRFAVVTRPGMRMFVHVVDHLLGERAAETTFSLDGERLTPAIPIPADERGFVLPFDLGAERDRRRNATLGSALLEMTVPLTVLPGNGDKRRLGLMMGGVEFVEPVSPPRGADNLDWGLVTGEAANTVRWNSSGL